MSDLFDAIDPVSGYDPPVSGVSVPLQTDITLSLTGVDYDDDSLIEGFFLEGPSGDLLLGPGILPLQYPEGIPAEDVRDILDNDLSFATPVDGVVTVVSGVDSTTLTFDPTYPLKANTLYTMNLTGVLELDGVTSVDGFVAWSFTTGTGSIEVLPVETSTSVLSTAAQLSNAINEAAPLKVVGATPSDHAIQQQTNLDEIEIEFNKDLDAASVVGAVQIETLPATDHPNASVTALGNLYKVVEVNGNKIKIKI